MQGWYDTMPGLGLFRPVLAPFYLLKSEHLIIDLSCFNCDFTEAAPGVGPNWNMVDLSCAKNLSEVYLWCERKHVTDNNLALSVKCIIKQKIFLSCGLNFEPMPVCLGKQNHHQEEKTWTVWLCSVWTTQAFLPLKAWLPDRNFD